MDHYLRTRGGCTAAVDELGERIADGLQRDELLRHVFDTRGDDATLDIESLDAVLRSIVKCLLGCEAIAPPLRVLDSLRSDGFGVEWERGV